MLLQHKQTTNTTSSAVLQIGDEDVSHSRCACAVTIIAVAGGLSGSSWTDVVSVLRPRVLLLRRTSTLVWSELAVQHHLSLTFVNDKLNFISSIRSSSSIHIPPHSNNE